jgi:hypothetical protein
MELAPVLAPVTCEVTYDQPDLDVAMSTYDTTSGSPVLIDGPTAMTLLYGNTYIGKTPEFQSAHSYVVVKAVYTDNTFDTLSPNYAAGSESFFAQDSAGGGSVQPGSVIGYVDEPQNVVGYINC